MEREQFAVWVALMQTYYDKFHPLDTTEKIEIWYREFAHIPADALTAALRKYVNSGTRAEYPPSIAELKTICNEIMYGALPDWGEAWNEVKKAIGRYGYMNAQQALDSMSPTTRETVRRVGWEDICMSENPDTIRAQFRKCYEIVAQREAEDRNISPDLRQMIAGIQLGQLPGKDTQCQPQLTTGSAATAANPFTAMFPGDDS